MEAATIFSCRGVIRQGVGHAARGLNVIRRKCHEKGLIFLIDNARFEQSAFSPDREPPSAFIRLGLSEDLPVFVHVPFELVNEVRPHRILTLYHHLPHLDTLPSDT